MTRQTARERADRQLKFSSILPDFAEWLAVNDERSAAAAAQMNLTRHAYGTAPRQWVEWAGGTGPAPILPIMIHGGYWRALEAQTHRFVLPALSRTGPAVANLEYRLMPDVRMGEVIEDTVAGLRQLASAFPDLQLLPIGHSAGGHLAVKALLQADDLVRRCAGLVSISGVYDLTIVSQSFLQDELDLSAEDIARFSITDMPDCPSLLVTGAAETPAFQDQATALADRTPQATRLKVANCHHMNVLHHGLTGTALLAAAIQAWLAGHPTPKTLEVSPE